jgi:hypothetical protein
MVFSCHRLAVVAVLAACAVAKLKKVAAPYCPPKWFFTRKEQQNNWRLGCQVKVRRT